MRYVITFILVFSVNAFVFAQSPGRSSYKLLWKISGNTLKKPSYLFGTMHVRDNKAFDFSDSVLLKIEACEAFALELHPDSLSKVALSMVFSQETMDNQISQSLSEAEYHYLDSLTQARTGLSLARFKTSREALASIMEEFGSNDRNTFLDAWLYNLARNQNKVILGLEDVKDQQALWQDDTKEQLMELKKYLEKDYDKLKDQYQSLLKNYYTGDIDALRKTTLQTGRPEEYETFIIKRNIKMTQNIVKEIHQHSTFVAVGAAHLPGDEGIISLLRKQGYQVTVVTPTFTGLAAKYKATVVEQKWITFTASEAGYAIEMPQVPVPLSLKKLPMALQTTLDIGTLTMFMSTHIVMAANMRNLPASQLFETLSKSLSNNGPIYNQKNLKVAGFDAIEFETGEPGQYVRMRVILRNPVIYFLAAGSTKETAGGTDANRFFNSFVTGPLALGSSNLKIFKHEVGAFSIMVPGKVSEQQTTQPIEGLKKPYKLNIFYSTDSKTGETFIFRYNDFPTGMISQNDSLYMHQSLELAVNNMKGIRVKKVDTTFVGYPCIKFEFEIPEQNLIAQGQNVLRGNRYYIWFTVRSSKLSTGDTRAFLKSMIFLPYLQTATKQVNFGDGISIKVPEHFEKDSVIDNENDSKRYSFIDTNSGISSSVQVEKINAYDQAPSVAEYFERIKTAIVDVSDSIINERPLKDSPGYELWISSPTSNALRYIKFLVADQKLISLWSYLPGDYKQSNLVSEIYDSFAVKAATPWSITTNKTDLIFQDLLSSDSVVQASAQQALYQHPFTEDELPKVYEAIKRHSNDPTSIRRSLFEALKNHHDSTTASFIQEIYLALPDTTTLRDSALGVLASLRTEGDTKTMIALMRQDNPRPIQGYEVLFPFYDSLSLFNSAITEMIDLEPRFEDIYFLFDLVKRALDSNALQNERRQTVIGQVVTLGTRLVNEPLATVNDNFYTRQHDRWLSLANLLTALPFTKEVKEIMLTLHNHHDVEIMVTTAVHLLKNGVSVSSADLNVISENPLYRIQLYERLKEINLEKRINKKFITPRMLAESDLYNFLSYEDGIPDNLELLMEKEIVYQNEKQHIFLYKYKYEGSEEWYGAMSGPFVIKPKSGFDRGSWTTSFYDSYESDERFVERVKAFVEGQGGSFIK